MRTELKKTPAYVVVSQLAYWVSTRSHTQINTLCEEKRTIGLWGSLHAPRYGKIIADE